MIFAVGCAVVACFDDECYVVFSCLVHFCFCNFLWAHILSLFHILCVDLKPKEAWTQSCATIVYRVLAWCLSIQDYDMVGGNVCSCLSRLDDWRVSGGALVLVWTSWKTSCACLVAHVCMCCLSCPTQPAKLASGVRRRVWSKSEGRVY